VCGRWTLIVHFGSFPQPAIALASEVGFVSVQLRVVPQARMAPRVQRGAQTASNLIEIAYLAADAAASVVGLTCAEPGLELRHHWE